MADAAVTALAAAVMTAVTTALAVDVHALSGLSFFFAAVVTAIMAVDVAMAAEMVSANTQIKIRECIYAFPDFLSKTLFFSFIKQS